MNIDIVLETRLWDIIGYDDADKIEQLLKEFYEETKYPGALYWLGINHTNDENHLYDMEKAIHYHKQASLKGYRNSMTYLAEYYMSQDKTYLNEAEQLIDDALELMDSEYARLLKAKIYLLQAIHYGELGKYKRALCIIEELYKEDFCPAVDFVLVMESQDEINSFH